MGSAGTHTLINAATMIFSLARQLRNTMQHSDIPGLLTHVTGLMRSYERTCIGQGVAPDTAYEARYILCAFLDEIVLNTPWGHASQWSQSSLLSSLHNDTRGGERFFQILANRSENPAPNIALLELMYHCLSLGFQGKFAIQENGQAAIRQIRAGLYHTLRQIKPAPEPDLSDNWQGVQDGRPAIARWIPWWVVGAVLSGVLVACYIGFYFSLNEASDQTFTQIGQLGREIPQMTRDIPDSNTLVEPETPGIDPTTLMQTLQNRLSNEIAARQISLSREPGGIKITVHNKGLFASGNAEVSPAYQRIFSQLADTLKELPGPILVSGHSDSQQIRTLRYPSNWHLSDDRARAVVAVLVRSGMHKERLVAQGKADTEPVADNNTAQGREQNRRVEILIRTY
ncbi:DotU family type VI secretion system protein [Bowmanella denitrificans]|uniref:DotU family type VI secretion system protein n=1 Tax=Bowmanella denitrificans TaxID=366582 RepID=A0ABP3GZR7_9ALTE